MGFISRTMSSSSSSSSSVGGKRKNQRGRGSSTSSTALTPNSLLKKYPLPVAAYLNTPETPPGLDTSRPLLLYSHYSSTKVRALSLRLSRDGGGLCPVGPALVIPDSYTGWFSVITQEGRSAPHYSSVELVAAAQIPFFLTRFDIPAYVRVVDENDPGRAAYHRTVIQGGHVLKLLGIFEDLNARKNSGESRHSNKDSTSSFVPSSKYIQCLNYCNEVIFVPFSATGRFYATAHSGKRSVSHLFLMSQLVNTFQLPLTVRLVCGFMPRVPQAFTGILRLEKSQKEAVILACTMTPEAKATLLEMDVTSNFVLSPVTDPIFSKTPIFLKTASYCSDEADSWRRQIKVTHHVTEDSSGSSLGRSSSDKTFESSSSSSKGFSSFFKDFEKRRGRARERSKTRDFLMRDKSRDISQLEKVKDKDIVRGREKSRESRIKDRVIDKLQDMSRGSNQCVVTGDFISIRVDDKLKPVKKVSDSRKITKQNTYIFQNERIIKCQDSKRWSPSLQAAETSPRSVENEEYSMVLDDLNAIQEVYERETTDDSTYAEICENKLISDARSGIVRADLRHWRTNLSDTRTFSSMSSTEDDNPYSFTLLKKDMGKCYARLPGLGVNDFIRNRPNRRDESAAC